MARLGVTIFGLGRAGQMHLKNVVQNYELELLYLVDIRVDHCKSLAVQYNQTQCQALSPDEQDVALGDKRVDFVMVCTHTPQHEPIVLEALKAGKPVFCEKPLAIGEEAVENCYKMATKAGVPLYCSFNRRFDSSIRKLYDSRSMIGQIQMIKACSRDPGMSSMEYMKVSGGVFHDSLVHDIDLVCWMAGEYPKQVFTLTHCFNEQLKSFKDVDTVAVVMKFESGILAIIDMSRDAVYGHDQRFEVFGSNGMLLNNNQRGDNLVIETSEGMVAGKMYDSFLDRYGHSYIASLNHFIQVVKGEESVQITRENVVNVSKISTALTKSSENGVKIDMEY